MAVAPSARRIFVTGGTGYLGSGLIGGRWFFTPPTGSVVAFRHLRSSATRLGLVTLKQMLLTLVWAVEHPPESAKMIEASEIRTLGSGG